ncbi:hypothetical protein B0J17DRAFT_209535 [Rhizoctonia solani]|nr:hypothetical protein B0J17DRAFT_209535 [Rhizoctonia solani]
MSRQGLYLATMLYDIAIRNPRNVDVCETRRSAELKHFCGDLGAVYASRKHGKQGIRLTTQRSHGTRHPRSRTTPFREFDGAVDSELDNTSDHEDIYVTKTQVDAQIGGPRSVYLYRDSRHRGTDCK